MGLSVLAHRDALGVTPGRLYIGGKWQEARSGTTWTHHHPATGEAVVDFEVASAADVADAVGAARDAFDNSPWPTVKAKERIALLHRISALIRRDLDEINQLQVLDNGMPLSFTGIYAVGADIAADIFDHHAGWVDKLTGDTFPPYTGADSLTLSLREPVGVIGAIIPWNAPVFLFAQKVAPALAAGCSVVLKPSEYASLAVLKCVSLLEEAGVPPGVFNLVLGPAEPTGEALITDPRLDKITFTGSRVVGSRIISASAAGITRVSLELGGKSPNLVFADVENLDLAALTAFGMVAMGLSGQGCVCQTRALVERPIYDEFLTKAAALAGMVSYGDPFAPGTTSGPIINQRQLDKVLGYIESAQQEGARLVVGGDRPGGDLAEGNFVNPTLFADVDNRMRIAQEEIFGPVLAVLPFDTEEEAVRLANDTSYGLGAGVQTANLARAIRVTRALRAGTVGVNTFGVTPHVPFGGYKTSGLGREGGRAGLEEFTELKTVILAAGAGF
ncbi:MAG: aldehyde dehydrogenase family protein [Mycobacteriales bacterium]